MKLAKRLFAAGLALAVLTIWSGRAVARAGGSKDQDNRSAADTLFTNGVLHVLQVEIPEAGVRSLNEHPRTYVPGILREGGTVYSNVLFRLKGGAGSFRRLDDKPGLTLKLSGPGGAFHGLKKFHLNNSVQDST